MRTRRLVFILAVIVPGLIIVGVGWAMNRPRWTPRLDHPNPAMRAAAIRALTREGNERILIELLQDEDVDVRMIAAMALADPFGHYHIRRRDEVARALVIVLRDKHVGLRWEAVYSLSWLGADAWPALREALASDNSRMRFGALAAMSDEHKATEWWPALEAKTIAPILKNLKSDPDSQVRERAKWILNKIERRRANQ